MNIVLFERAFILFIFFLLCNVLYKYNFDHSCLKRERREKKDLIFNNDFLENPKHRATKKSTLHFSRGNVWFFESMLPY